MQEQMEQDCIRESRNEEFEALQEQLDEESPLLIGGQSAAP